LAAGVRGAAQEQFERGNARAGARRWAEALAAFDAVLALDPGHAPALAHRASVLTALGQAEAALDGFAAALAREPGRAETWNNRGAALMELGRPREAMLDYMRAIALKPDFAEPRQNLGIALLQEGEFEHGWFFYEWRLRTPNHVAGPAYAQPRWTGQPGIAGSTILVHAEQGFGDVIQFYRYVPLLAAMGARIILGVQPELRRLLDGLAPSVTVIAPGVVLPRLDWHCPLLSLPVALGARLETIPPAPYLTAPAELRARWAARLPSGRKRVGIAWRGNPNPDPRRSMPLDFLRPLLALDVDWTCLHPDLTQAERASLARLGVRGVSDDLTDFAETAGLLACLDLVITVDTSVAHLAGALGRPVWVLLPAHADWRWMRHRSDSVWYGSARLFRQRHDTGWPGLVGAVIEALELLNATEGTSQ
jgi:hypothetical protein